MLRAASICALTDNTASVRSPLDSEAMCSRDRSGFQQRRKSRSEHLGNGAMHERTSFKDAVYFRSFDTPEAADVRIKRNKL